ncbi:MAG: PAS domain S-box protein [Beijerinckiaceae bacterium]|nr:PAS domain S-box protein [Beijerinckiaceae bacterium]
MAFSLNDAQRFASIVEGSEDAIISKTLDGRITFWNQGAVNIFGYNSSEMIGRSIYQIIPPELRAEEKDIIAKLSRGERVDHFDTIRVAKNGAQIAVSLTVSPLRDVMGNIIGASKVARDISDRKRVEETLRAGNEALSAANEALRQALSDAENARRMQENTVESSPSAMVMISAAGKIEMVNAQTERLFGYPRSELLGQSVEMLLPDRLRNSHPRLSSAFFSDPKSRPTGAERDLFGLRKDGSEFPIEIGLNSIETSEGVAMVMSAIIDMTAPKRAEEALRHANEVAQRARIEAENANQAKTDFLAVMSHEIRTPLTSISGFVDLLTCTGELTPQQRRHIDLVKTANAALLTIVNDILDFSKVEAGQMELECRPFSISALVQDTVAIVQPIAVAKKLALDFVIANNVNEWIIGDPARLRQILLNLLNNAVKFTEMGTISLAVGLQKTLENRERLRFSIVDTGIGISADQQRRLFNKFTQADSSVSRRHGGTGLGLAICKRLVELMDGEIHVVSDAGRGTSVWFTCYMPPVGRPAPKTEIDTPPEAADARKARILVVDDIDTNREILEAYLQDNGYCVGMASSGDEAIRMLQNDSYDLVLMDIQMPVMDGVTATQHIRALPAKVRDIPIVAMTGNVLPQQVKSFLAAGMNDHVGKPIEKAKLYSSVRRWLPEDRRCDSNRA